VTAPVIAAVDPGEAAEAGDAIALGTRLANAYATELAAVTICSPDADAGEQERAAAELIRAAGSSAPVTAIPCTSPARRLHELCDRLHPAALVIGSGRPAASGDARLGAVAEPLLHGGAAPVAIAVRGYAKFPDRLATIGAAFAGTPESREALRRATELAGATGARLRVLSVAEPREWAFQPGGVEVTWLEGDPAVALAAESARLDLLVVGSRSYGPLGAVLLGAVTRRLVPAASCPVLVVPRVPDAALEPRLVGGMEARVIG
jgi:nucleotide-binding universal stress UspA family protein